MRNGSGADGGGHATRVLVVSSFVLPHAGGVEQFVERTRQLLGRRGCSVRVLACRRPRAASAADAAVPTWFLPRGGWPLPIGGWRTVWREVGRADVVVANGSRHLLPAVATFIARARGRQVLFVLHGSGASFSTGSLVYHRLLGSIFERLIARPALRRSLPVSLCRAGVDGARARYGVAAEHIPYPIRELPTAPPGRALAADEPLTIVWVGRLYPEKDPLRAVAVVERLRRMRDATLEFYGDGVLAPDLQRLALERPWMHVRGERSWEEIQLIQAEANVCLSTSLRDATQLAVLEPLSRGIPVVSTAVGDAPHHYVSPSLRRFCVEPANVAASASAIFELAGAYERHRHEFAANGELLQLRHSRGEAALASLVEATAARSNGRGAQVPNTGLVTEPSEL